MRPQKSSEEQKALDTVNLCGVSQDQEGKSYYIILYHTGALAESAMNRIKEQLLKRAY